MSWWTSFRDKALKPALGASFGIGAGMGLGGAAMGPAGAAIGGLMGGSAGAGSQGGFGGPGGGLNPDDPYAGMPELPTDQLAGVTQDKSGLNAFAGEALRTGPSRWAGLATQQQDQSEMDAFNRGMGQAAARGQEGMDSLAMQGGLTSGAAERMAKGTARNMLDVGQDVARQGDSNRLQIGINDEQNRISQLGMLPGMQLASSGFDLQKAMGQNQFNAQNYNTRGSIWAAGKQADAMDPRNPNSPNYDDGKRWYNPFSW